MPFLPTDPGVNAYADTYFDKRVLLQGGRTFMPRAQRAKPYGKLPRRGQKMRKNGTDF
jgi:hypothetical protein